MSEEKRPVEAGNSSPDVEFEEIAAPEQQKDADFDSVEEPVPAKAQPEFKENINYVTPYAFGVSETIYGLPLATPRKRLVALIIDGIFITMLTHLSYIILFGLSSALFINASLHLKKKARNRYTRKGLKVLGGFCFLIFAFGALNAFFEDKPASESANAGETAEVVSIDVSQEPIAADTNTTPIESESDVAVNPVENASESGDESVDVDTAEKQSAEESDTEASQDKIPDISEGFAAWLEAVLKQFGVSFGWAAFYFSVLLGWFSGQTIGKHVMGIRVIKQDGTELTLWDAFGRYGGYGAGFATGLLGFLQVYWDPNRQAIQDKISNTLVVDIHKKPIDLT